MIRLKCDCSSLLRPLARREIRSRGAKTSNDPVMRMKVDPVDPGEKKKKSRGRSGEIGGTVIRTRARSGR